MTPHPLSPRSSVLLHRYAVLTAIATLILLIVGGLVTSTDAGLSVPDWPLSYGSLFPPMVGGIRYEHTHRLIAGVVALMILALAVWLRRVETRRWVRRLGLAALLAVIAQAVLGGLTVLWLLPPTVSVAHACLGQGVFVLVACVMLATSAKWSRLEAASVSDLNRPSLRLLSVMLTELVFLQLVLGALLRHAGTMLIPHVLVALAVVGITVMTLRRAARTPQLPDSPRKLAVMVMVFVGLQVVLGPAALFSRDRALLTTAHQVLGALVLAHAALLAMVLARVTKPV